MSKLIKTDLGMVLCDLPCAQAYYRYMAPPNTSKQHTHTHTKNIWEHPPKPQQTTHTKAIQVNCKNKGPTCRPLLQPQGKVK